ncbi:MAG: DUF2497 domain-containing protein [Devosia sp.]|nr:DUF2497 domain-containing protein [Devosia sp.]
MNKPAPKEPSMDEILSSIRQIIADDDAGAVPRKPVAAPPAAPPPRSFAPPPVPVEAEPEPLALSAEQILHDTAVEDMAGTGVSFSEVLGETSTEPVSLVDPDDIAFETDRDEEPLAPPPPPPAPPPVAVRPAPVAERPAPRPAVTVSQAAPLPDPRLTVDLAEQLLEPTTQSIVKGSFARLSNMSTIGANVTIEQMMREMLRPMLKEWLDENLPAVVERIVEQEIARVSRGGR